jgi:hypothetical protein
VIESVLMMTKEPTKSAMPPKASRKYWKVEICFEVSAEILLASCAPVRTVMLRGSVERSSLTSRSGETPGLASAWM